MKKILMLVLGLFSIVCSGQSDLSIELSNVGNQNSPNYRSIPVKWRMKVKNIGVSNADIVQYRIFVSEDEFLDANDYLVKIGQLGNLEESPETGLLANQDVTLSDVRLKPFDFPQLLDFNKDYFIIFDIKQDLVGGEVNMDNNKVAVPLYLEMENILEVVEIDSSPLLDKTPLLLIHGWQPRGRPAPTGENIWDNFLEYFDADFQLYEEFKPYYVKYLSNIVPINDLGHELRRDLDDISEFSGKNITMLAHSMGGLVSRSFAKRTREDGPIEYAGEKGGERINRLITLGTPHHGSPFANGEIRGNGNSDLLEYLSLLDNSFYSLSTVGEIPSSTDVNRSDLKWDNFDDNFDYNGFPFEYNDWLNSEEMNGDPNNYFDDKIVAYGGYITDRGLFSISSDFLSGMYFMAEIVLNTELNFPHNDGIVPYSSAVFEGHTLENIRAIPNHYHDEIVKGRYDENFLDYPLFNVIKGDLLSVPVNSQIQFNKENIIYSETVINNTTSEEIVINNLGDMPLSITSIQLIGTDNAEFDFNFPDETITILPNGVETFIVNFSPTSVGDKTVTFRVNNSSVNSPQLDIQLTGLAVETAETDYNTNTGSVYDFGDVYVYGGTGLTSMSISNSSSAPYIIEELNIVGADSNMFNIVQQPSLPLTLNPGDVNSVVLSFDPDTVGEKNAIVEIHFENYSIPVTANLLGNGVNTVNNPNTPKLINYEYWYNDDYASRQSVNLAGDNSTEQLDFLASPLTISNGLNSLHFRVKDSDGNWSSVSSDYVFIQNNINGSDENQVVLYEYWFNDDYENRVVENTNGTNPLILNMDANVIALENGLHQFHIRFKDKKGQWSSITSEFIYNNFSDATGENKIVEYRYWFNDDFDNRIINTIEPEVSYVFIEDVNISGLTNNSMNYIHFQFKDTNGSWSSVLTEEFIFETLSLSNENIAKLNLYPNPTNSIIYIANQDINGELKVYDNLGKLILDFKTIPNEIDISNFESGLYLFYVKSNDDKIYQEKVIKY